MPIPARLSATRTWAITPTTGPIWNLITSVRKTGQSQRQRTRVKHMYFMHIHAVLDDCVIYLGTTYGLSTHGLGIARHMLDNHSDALSAWMGSYCVKGPSTVVLSDLVPLAVHSKPAFATAQPASSPSWGLASQPLHKATLMSHTAVLHCKISSS